MGIQRYLAHARAATPAAMVDPSKRARFSAPLRYPTTLVRVIFALSTSLARAAEPCPAALLIPT